MGFAELFLIGVGLSMDAFAVSICKGLGMKRVNYRHALVIALFFGGFQALMPVIGWLLGSQFASLVTSVAHWIAFGLLAFIGGKMLWDALSQGGSDSEGEADAKAKAAHDRLDVRELLMLAVATSIDALAVGVSFACLGISSWREILYPITAIGWVSFALSIVGLLIGIAFDRSFARKLKAERWGGLILILIGCKVLTEHLLG